MRETISTRIPGLPGETLHLADSLVVKIAFQKWMQ